MNVMVADTSVLIDLERGFLLEQSFALPFSSRVPDLLYRNELEGRQAGPAFGERLLRLGLEIVELSGDEVRRAVLLVQRKRSLSLPDSFALTLASSRNWTLLTGDAVLRTLAQCLKVTSHGVWWVLDYVHSLGIATSAELISGLTRIRDHPSCRLPKAEIDMRLLHYSASYEQALSIMSGTTIERPC